MSSIQKVGSQFILAIDENLASEDYLQRFLELLQFRSLARKNQMSGEEAAELAEDLKKSGWKSIEGRFQDL